MLNPINFSNDVAQGEERNKKKKSCT